MNQQNQENQEAYTPPQSDVIEIKRLSVFQSCILILLTIIAVGCYYVAYAFPIKFIEVLEGFDAELPLLTELVIRIHPTFAFLSYFSAVFLLGFIRPIVGYEKQRLVFKAAKINAVLSFVLMLIVVISMYLPMFVAM